MLASPWGSYSVGSMHRLTARLLLFFALVGSLVPVALAASAAPTHACCLRKGFITARIRWPRNMDSP